MHARTVALLIAFTIFGCKKADEESHAATTPTPTADTGPKLTVTTPAFLPGQKIPVEYTCDGKDVNPEITWSGAPAAAKSFLLIVDDPDAPVGTFTHWVIFDMPAPMNAIPEAAAGIGTLGKNDFGNAKWNGPCPPKGKEHRYFFKLFALDVEKLGLSDGVSRADVEKKIDGHVVAKGETMGTFVH